MSPARGDETSGVRITRNRLVASVVAALVALPGVALLTAPAASAAQVLTPTVPAATQHRQILDGLNRERAAVGAPPVTLDPTLESVAQRWADTLGQGTGMKHNPDLSRLLADFPQWGEIVATADMGEPDTTGMENGDLAVDSWMKSDPHRAVLQDAKFSSVGIGLVYTTTWSGTRTVWRSYWVADFGTARRTPLGANAEGGRNFAGVPVKGAILATYAATGADTGALGRPLGTEFGPLRAGGFGQAFAGGSVYYSPATGAHVLKGAVRDRWAALGWENCWLGYPTAAESGIRGGVVQRFQGGLAYFSPTTGAQAVRGAILAGYGAQGWENGTLGFPTTSETALPGGAFTHFQGGSIYWSPAGGAHVVTGAVRDAWAAQGWETGRLGYPVGDARTVSGATRQDFQGGDVTVTGGRAAVHLR